MLARAPVPLVGLIWFAQPEPSLTGGMMYYSNTSGSFSVERFLDAPDDEGRRSYVWGYTGKVGRESFRGVSPSEETAVQTGWEILSWGSAKRRDAERLRLTSTRDYEHPADIRKALVVPPKPVELAAPVQPPADLPKAFTPAPRARLSAIMLMAAAMGALATSGDPR